jgi:hypothetical protein
MSQGLAFGFQGSGSNGAEGVLLTRQACAVDFHF